MNFMLPSRDSGCKGTKKSRDAQMFCVSRLETSYVLLFFNKSETALHAVYVLHQRCDGGDGAVG